MRKTYHSPTPTAIKRNNSAPTVMDPTNQRVDKLLNLINTTLNSDVRELIYNIKKTEAEEMRLIKNEVKIFDTLINLFIIISENNTNSKGYYDAQSDDNSETEIVRENIQNYVDRYQLVVPKQFTLLAGNASDYIKNKDKHVHTLVYYMLSHTHMYTPCLIYPPHNKIVLTTIQQYADALTDNKHSRVNANTPVNFDSNRKCMIFMNKGFLKWLQSENKKHYKKLNTYMKVFKTRFFYEDEEDEYETYLRKLDIIKAYYKNTNRVLTCLSP